MTVTYRRIVHVAGLALLWLLPAFAGSIPVVTLSLSADIPSAGVQEIAITNDTGSTNGCNSTYVVCDALSITNWRLEVSYTSTYYNVGGGPSLATPYVALWASSADDILPTAAKTLDFDLCGVSDVSSCSGATTMITGVIFTGTLGQSSFAIYDPTANGGSGGAGPTFFADPSISFSVTPTGSFPSDYYESQDGSVSDQSNSVPEPGSLLLALGGLAAGFRRRDRR